MRAESSTSFVEEVMALTLKNRLTGVLMNLSVAPDLPVACRVSASTKYTGSHSGIAGTISRRSLRGVGGLRERFRIDDRILQQSAPRAYSNCILSYQLQTTSTMESPVDVTNAARVRVWVIIPPC